MEMFERFSELGVRVFVTEFDVDLFGVPGSEKERWHLQAEIYENMFKACLEAESCDTFTIWGVTDSISWLSYGGWEYADYLSSGTEPLPFDFYMNPKPAYFAMRKALYEDQGFRYIGQE